MSDGNKVLGKIALSLSGGGYRAASFHLGALEMLNELDLLEDVTIVSTVSGGSITGAFYVSCVADAFDFGAFRDLLYRFLKSTNVMRDALRDVENTRKAGGESAMPSLIRAAATVYDGEKLLNGKTFAQLEAVKVRFDEIVINATEFRSGGSFRFVQSTNPKVCSGNNAAEIDNSISRTIRIADAVAASSCFPSGFEPIRFPSDFVWPKGTNLPSIRESLGGNFATDVPLMDGGIFDNQGVDSIRNIQARKNSDVGLFIVSDTSARRAKPFEFPPQRRGGILPLWVWRIFLYLLLFGSAFAAVAVGTEAYRTGALNELNSFRSIFLFVIPLIFSLSISAFLLYALVRIRKLMRFAKAETGIDLWDCLKDLTFPEILSLVSSRVESLIEMTTNVFMKRVRSMTFESVFADLGLKDKLVPNLIYDIDNEERWGKEIKTAGLQPTNALREVARRAESYKTNLWFLDASELDNLILCGRATMCFKILKYLLRQKPAEIGIPRTPESELFKKVRAIWIQLNRDD